MAQHSQDKRPVVVILGGGFGGAYCAQTLRRELRRGEADILLIDRQNHFVFYPLLVEAGTGSLQPRHTVVSIRAFLRGGTFRMAEVTGLDTKNRRVQYRQPGTGECGTIVYDRLVVACGSAPNLPQVPGLRRHAFGVKSIADVVALRDHAVQMLELADATPALRLRRALLRFVVVGANFTGVEVAGEFCAFLKEATRAYANVWPDDVSVTLVELSDRILGALDEDLARYATAQLQRCGIDLRLNESVAGIAADGVVLRSGDRLEARTVVWCAGIAPSPVVSSLGFPTDERGYILTGRDLRVPGFEDVWAIGDCAVNPGPDGRPYPATAQHAVRQGTHAAKDIARSLRGLPARPCDIASAGSLAALAAGRRWPRCSDSSCPALWPGGSTERFTC